MPVWHLNPPPPPRAPPPRAPPAPPKGPQGRMLQQHDIMDYNIPAMIYAFWLSIITLCFALFVVFKPGYISGKIEKLFTFLYLVLMVLWVIEAFWTTFPGSSATSAPGSAWPSRRSSSSSRPLSTHRSNWRSTRKTHRRSLWAQLIRVRIRIRTAWSLSRSELHNPWALEGACTKDAVDDHFAARCCP